MKKVQINPSKMPEGIRSVLMRFVQTAKQQGYDDAYIETVINRIIATDAHHLKAILQQDPRPSSSTSHPTESHTG